MDQPCYPETMADPEETIDLQTENRRPAECPFHTVMRQLAGVAVRQHVLHTEGEVLPRSDLIAALDGWQQLYHLVLSRVCPATRIAPLPPIELAALIDAALLHLLPPTQAPLRTRLCRQLGQCALSSSSQDCPLYIAPSSTFS